LIRKKLDIKKGLIFVLILLFFDQFLKFYIKLNFPLSLYNQPAIIDLGFFKLLFIENEGMAMGAKLNNIFPFLSDYSAKLSLTIFRLIAVVGIGYWLISALKNNKSNLFKITLCLIFAGALGNIIDSVFYGQWFSSSYGQVATFLPETGYAPLFFGNVVDMLQFPIATWIWPQWFPFIGGESFTFFEYVFNFADAYISTGVLILIFFNKRFSY
jgi:signal peptidase II